MRHAVLATSPYAVRIAALLTLTALGAGLSFGVRAQAFDAVRPILDVIRLIPGATPELIESSCCGMAGTFGYEARHIEVSMQMAELSLLPAVRNQPDALIVADGTSCRHQIRDGAQREAVHVARLLADHLGH